MEKHNAQVEAMKIFDSFCSAITLKQIQVLHRQLCYLAHVKPNRLPEFYPKLKAFLASSWKAQALFKKFDARVNHKIYGKNQICSNNKVLIVGAGPCGLRTAIECQLLGAKVIVIEKREFLSRNNVVHLWPFVIHDLKAFGAKKFNGKFCTGAIDHTSIRQLQCILLKMALLLGVEVFEGVAYEDILEPSITETNEVLGWRAKVEPADHPVSAYEFDIVIGADGKRNSFQGFKKVEFRGRQCLGITANFINKQSEQEVAVQEISGVSYVFNQKLFNDLTDATGIELENMVYYKDDTHYFVMTPKKHCLLAKGVFREDYADETQLLCRENLNKDALMNFAKEVASFLTNGQLPLDFALNHCGEPDVAVFDFSSFCQSDNASIIREKIGKRLLVQLVGDSLMEPFWPTGTGCARGFLSSFDAAWAIRRWGLNLHPLQIIAERESVYRMLRHRPLENLQSDYGAYSLDPASRYGNYNTEDVPVHSVINLYKSDDPLPLDSSMTKKRRREPEISTVALLAWLGCKEEDIREAIQEKNLLNVLKKYRPDLLGDPDRSYNTVYDLIQQNFGITQISKQQLNEGPEATLRDYLTRLYYAFKGEVPHIHYDNDTMKENIDIALKNDGGEGDKFMDVQLFKRRRQVINSNPDVKPSEVSKSEQKRSGTQVARLAKELSSAPSVPSTRQAKPKDLMRAVGKITKQDWNVQKIEKKINENKLGRPGPSQAERVPKWDKEQFIGRQRKLGAKKTEDPKFEKIDNTIRKVDQKIKDSGRPESGTEMVAKLAKKFVKDPVSKSEKKPVETKKTWNKPSTTSKRCLVCSKTVFLAESIVVDGITYHKGCFRCSICKRSLSTINCNPDTGGRLFCRFCRIKAMEPLPPKKERISLELVDEGVRDIDEDEWTDRNFITSEASAAGLSDDSSSEDERDDKGELVIRSVDHRNVPIRKRVPRIISDESPRYDDNTDDEAESTEDSQSLREAREARRREVPADALPPYTSSEMETDEYSDSDSSDEEQSSATEVSTDSEFAREESMAIPSPPAILVTEVPSHVPPPQDFPLSRTKSAGGLATKRALELKRKYLLGEPSPPAVRKSESTSHLDSKLEAFRSNITEFQKMLNPATPTPQTITPYLSYQLTTEEKKTQPEIPDIIKNIWNKVPVDLLTKDNIPLCNKEWSLPEKNEKELDLETDSLSDSTHSESMPNQSVPRVEVHDEGGELIQLDSLILVSNETEDAEEKISGTVTSSGPTVVAAESESSESCKDATTLALTETELSDWAAESAVLDECVIDENGERKRSKNPRSLSGPKLIHEAKNIEHISSHVCGKGSSEKVDYFNALEHFKFADEGDQDPGLSDKTPCNDGYMELVDDDYEPYSPSKDRSMNFIERVYSDTTVKSDPNDTLNKITSNFSDTLEFIDSPSSKSESNANDVEIVPNPNLTSISNDNINTNKHLDDDTSRSLSKSVENNKKINEAVNLAKIQLESLTLTETSPPLVSVTDKKDVSRSESLTQMGSSIENSPPLVTESVSSSNSLTSPKRMTATRSHSLRTYAPAICRSASETFNRSNSRITNSTSYEGHWSPSVNIDKQTHDNRSPVKIMPIDKVQELKREREEQTEVVRRLVLERLGAPRVCRKSTRRNRISPSSLMPPPIPPPPLVPAPLCVSPMPAFCASPVFPAVPPRPSSQPRTSLSVQSSFSDPELTRQRRPKSFIKSISNYINKRLGPRHKNNPSTSEAPPVPPPPMDFLEALPPVPPPPVEPIEVRESRAIVTSEPEVRAPPVPPPPNNYTHPAQSLQAPENKKRRQKKQYEEKPRLARKAGRLERVLSDQEEEEQASTMAKILEIKAKESAHQALEEAASNAGRRRLRRMK